MDLSEVAAFPSKIHSHREIPEDGDSRETLEIVFLCTIPGHLGATPTEYQFLESTIIERSTKKVARIEISSVPMEYTATLESCYDEKQAMNFTITADETISYAKRYIERGGETHRSVRCRNDLCRCSPNECGWIRLSHKEGGLMVGETTWLFGLPCSGKTTIAKGLVGPKTVHLDGDYLRDTLNTDLGFSKGDRTENLRRAAGIAEGLNKQGFDVVASFITPYESQREMIREKVSDIAFIHVKAPIEVCEERDVKGMYEQARKGEIENFTGIDAPFEVPEQGEGVFEVRTATHSKKESIKKINMELNRKSEPSHIFLGRWQPLHDGHRTIIDSVADNRKEVVIAIRDTELNEKNPFTAQERKEFIEDVYSNYPNVRVMIVPDIDTVAIGREVGYSIVSVPEEIAEISGTETRREYEKRELLAGKHLSE